MKKKNIVVTLMLASMVLLSGNSCTREEPMLPHTQEPALGPVSLKLSVAGMEAGTPETKAVVEPDLMEQGLDPLEKAKQQISSFCVLQFAHTGSEALLISREYYDGDKVPAILDGTDPISVLYSSSKTPGPFTFVVIVNTPNDKITANINQTTLTDFSRNKTSLSGYNQIFTKIGDKEYLRMNGATQVETVDQSTTLEVSLIRNVSKITINVTNATTGDDKVALQKVQLRGINGKYYYRTPLGADKEPAYEDPYSATEETRFDKDQEVFPAAGNDGTVQTYTYYVPANLRGTTNSQYQYTKGMNAPDGATRFCMYGTYGEGENQTSINYTYYLGEDLVRDFNLKPNHHYTYNITLSAKGDARYDYRVEDLAEVKFHTDANCYMVHPPKVAGQSRIYAIPIRRAAVFWNKEGENGGVYGASQWEKYENIKITPETVWTAEVLASDFTIPSDFWIKKEGIGYDPTLPTHKPYFKFKVKAGMKGNAQIAVKVDGVIVWSWHIWITDYNPDREGLTPVAGTYIYDVEGGKVHRYTGEIWDREPTDDKAGYKNGFIMDRNLGALGNSFEGHLKALYYEYGRKDPFGGYMPPNYVIRAVDTGEPIFIFMEGDKKTYAANNIRYTVCNPKYYINNKEGGNSPTWTINQDNEDKISIVGGGSGWFDPKYWSHNGDQDILEKKKSIYDPCPAGWKVPKIAFVKELTKVNDPDHPENGYTYTIEEDNPKRIIARSSDPGSGYDYYPEGYINKDKTGVIYFPAMSFLDSSSGAFPRYTATSNNNYSRYWADEVDAMARASQFTINAKSAYAFTDNRSLHGYQVRCVREYGVVNN